MKKPAPGYRIEESNYFGSNPYFLMWGKHHVDSFGTYENARKASYKKFTERWVITTAILLMTLCGVTYTLIFSMVAIAQ